MGEDQSLDALRKRIELSESGHAITNLVHGYAFNIRKGTPANCAELFTEDAVFEMREASAVNPASFVTNRTLTGRSAIADYIGMTGKRDFRVYPLIYNMMIEIDGHEANSTAMMTAQTFPGGKQLMGEYYDSFRYEGRWLFSHRIHTVLRDSAP